MATHSSILAWKIAWTEEPGGLNFMGLQRENMTEHACMLRHTLFILPIFSINNRGITSTFSSFMNQPNGNSLETF